MDTVKGLRPLNRSDNTIKRKKQRALANEASPREHLRPSASPVDTFINTGRAPDVSSQTRQLSEALRSFTPMLDRYVKDKDLDNQQLYEQHVKEQEALIPQYVAQLQKDFGDGSIDQAQMKTVFPELVPSVAARIAQSMGANTSRKWMQSRIQSVLENDEIRLNTARRQAEYEKIKTEAQEVLVGNDPFYIAGYMRQLDNSWREFETGWLRETAAYHEKQQLEDFSSQIREAVKSGNPQNILAVDGAFKSSSLSNLQRKEAAARTIINTAISENNEKLLDNIPEIFLNANIKADIDKAILQINNNKFTLYKQQQYLDEDKRKKEYRAGQIKILELVGKGEAINLKDYSHQPELRAYAEKISTGRRVGFSSSVAMKQKISTGIMMAGTTGNFSDTLGSLGFNIPEEDVSENTLIDWIVDHSELNPTEQMQLIKEIPQLMAGVNFIRDPDFNTYFEDNIGSDAKVYASSVLGNTGSIAGVNVLGEVRKAYSTHIRQAVLEHIREHGELPRNRLVIAEKAGDAARKRLEFIQKNMSSLSKEKLAESRSGGARIDSDRGLITLSTGKTIKATIVEEDN